MPRASCRISSTCSSNFEEPRKEVAQEIIPESRFNPAFLKKVDELELSVRSANCLKNDNIVYIGDLVQKSEAEMLRTPNFGPQVAERDQEVLAQMGLHLGMEVPGWPPENIRRARQALRGSLLRGHGPHGSRRASALLTMRSNSSP